MLCANTVNSQISTNNHILFNLNYSNQKLGLICCGLYVGFERHKTLILLLLQDKLLIYIFTFVYIPNSNETHINMVNTEE